MKNRSEVKSLGGGNNQTSVKRVLGHLLECPFNLLTLSGFLTIPAMLTSFFEASLKHSLAFSMKELLLLSLQVLTHIDMSPLILFTSLPE